MTASASYYRFVVLHDYTVGYEGDCDPAVEYCYIGCEDDECTEEYFYSYITRPADELRALCGPDITDCDEAYECKDGDSKCSIEFCDPSYDEECSDLLDI